MIVGAATAGGVVALLLAGGLAGPRVLRRLSPSFARQPRLGIATWSGAVATWTLGLLALGPLLAWVLAGPSLPGNAGAICRRCVEAANPFGSAGVPAGVPPAVLVGLPVLVTIGLAGAIATTFVRARCETAAQLAALRETGQVCIVAGRSVWLLPSPAPAAYALPSRDVGIVVSDGALAALDEDQLGAVLTHESAHLRGRHHLLMGLLRAARTVLGSVPLVSAAPAAVADYAEMVADDTARRSHGTRALAGALLALHAAAAEARDVRSGAPVPTTALHAAAHGVPSRVQRLVAGRPAADRVAVTVVGGYLLAVAAAVALVVGPYLTVLLRGAC